MNIEAENLVNCALNKQTWWLKTVGGLELIFSPLLSESSSLVHAFTTRLGGSSLAPYDSFNLKRDFEEPALKEDAMQNRARLCAELGLDGKRLVVPGQVHSSNVIYVSEPGSKLNVDGLITDRKDLPMLVHFADCVPVAIFDRKMNKLALVHAGWRGTASGIVRESVKLLQKICGCQAKDLVAAVGPAIAPCCYPTGSDVAVKLVQSLYESTNGSVVKPDNLTLSDVENGVFSPLFSSDNGNFCPDLKAINAFQLMSCGVLDVDVSDWCTACNPSLFYSHRQSGGVTGRQGLIACLQ